MKININGVTRDMTEEEIELHGLEEQNAPESIQDQIDELYLIVADLIGGAE